jgi:hypothetical protein
MSLQQEKNSMEANRDAAEELCRRSREAVQMGELRHAVSLLERANRLFPVGIWFLFEIFYLI